MYLPLSWKLWVTRVSTLSRVRPVGPFNMECRRVRGYLARHKIEKERRSAGQWEMGLFAVDGGRRERQQAPLMKGPIMSNEPRPGYMCTLPPSTGERAREFRMTLTMTRKKSATSRLTVSILIVPHCAQCAIWLGERGKSEMSRFLLHHIVCFSRSCGLRCANSGWLWRRRRRPRRQ